MTKLLASLLIVAFNLSNAADQDGSGRNCFTIIVGKNASVDGSVFIAHNEDNSGDAFVDLHKVTRIKHAPSDKQMFAFGTDSINEVPETLGYLWITASSYNAEQYVNEWGVAVTSNASRSKVSDGKGKIEHNLRRLVAERARSAREAVKIAGSLIEKYGYASSGRVYSMADPDEAWVLEVANGWYNLETDKSFNFRKVYCRQDKLDAVSNIARKWIALVSLSPKWYKFYSDFPFSFKPKQKIPIQDLMRILQNHYENTEFEINPSYAHGCPHSNTTTTRICNSRTDFGSVIQLRRWLPAGIGNVMWVAPRNPCCQPFIPWYYGIDRDYKSLYPGHAYYVFDRFMAQVDSSYGKEIKSVRKWKNAFEADIFKTLKTREIEIAERYRSDPAGARQLLSGLSNRFAEKALIETKEKLSQ
jgi:dipeptidase